jgi:hypothetical protein
VRTVVRWILCTPLVFTLLGGGCGNAALPPVGATRPPAISAGDSGNNRAAIRIAGFVAPEGLLIHRVEVYVGAKKAYSSDLPDEHEDIGSFDLRGEEHTIEVRVIWSNPAITGGECVFVVFKRQWRLVAADLEDASSGGGIDIEVVLRPGLRIDVTLLAGRREVAATGAPPLETLSVEDILRNDPAAPQPSIALTVASKEARHARRSLFEMITHRDVMSAFRIAARTRGSADHRRCLDRALDALDAVIASGGDHLEGLGRALDRDDPVTVQGHVSEIERLRQEASHLFFEASDCVYLHGD